MREEGGRAGNQLCSLHKSTTQSDADCRIQQIKSMDAPDGSAEYAACYDPDHPIAFTAVKAPIPEELFKPFGPTNEPVDTTSGLFGSFGGISGEETSFMAEEGPALELGLRECAIGGLAAMIRAPVIVATLHQL